MKRDELWSEERFAEEVRQAVGADDGARLWEENERLSADPALRPTPEAYERAREAVRAAYARQDRRHGRVRAIRTAFAAAAAAVLLMTGAFAAIPAVRQLAKGIFMRDDGDHMTLWYEGTDMPSPSGSGPLLGFDLPDAPEGYELTNVRDMDVAMEAEYKDGSGNTIKLMIGPGDGSFLDVNTELAAEVLEVSIGGDPGLIITDEDGLLHLVLYNNERMLFVDMTGCTSEVVLLEMAEQLFAIS